MNSYCGIIVECAWTKFFRSRIYWEFHEYRIHFIGENVTDTLYHIDVASSTFELTTLMVIGTDCTGSCKLNYHTITTTMSPGS